MAYKNNLNGTKSDYWDILNITVYLDYYFYFELMTK